jgi:hypothetical protein
MAFASRAGGPKAAWGHGSLNPRVPPSLCVPHVTGRLREERGKLNIEKRLLTTGCPAWEWPGLSGCSGDRLGKLQPVTCLPFQSCRGWCDHAPPLQLERRAGLSLQAGFLENREESCGWSCFSSWDFQIKSETNPWSNAI